MTKLATFKPSEGLSNLRRLKCVAGDDDWQTRGEHPDWVCMENEDGERVYIYAQHVIYLKREQK